MQELTAQQTKVLRFIQWYVREWGWAPTRREIADDLCISSANAAQDHVKALARKGVIGIIPGIKRGIRLMDTTREQIALGV